MSFVHDDPDFAQLLAIVARSTGIAAALVEKDYWVTHCLWALRDTGLELWFKGGTSLSKGFGLIRRFSEDIDLMVQHGTVKSLPPVANWTSTNKGPVAARRAFYDALPGAFAIPAVKVEADTSRRDKHARGVELLGRYPGELLDQLAPTMSPFVRFEIGRARVVPFVELPLTSFVHDVLERQGQLTNYTDNRPRAVRCVHPMVTLIEKLDALSRRYARAVIEPDGFVRHYEDAAHIIHALGRTPAIEQSARELADEMLRDRDIVGLPRVDEPALLLADGGRRAEIMRAFERIGPMFWGERVPVDDACATIIEWIRGSIGESGASAKRGARVSSPSSASS
jgi:hypothetical protein